MIMYSRGCSAFLIHRIRIGPPKRRSRNRFAKTPKGFIFVKHKQDFLLNDRTKIFVYDARFDRQFSIYNPTATMENVMSDTINFRGETLKVQKGVPLPRATRSNTRIDGLAELPLDGYTFFPCTEEEVPNVRRSVSAARKRFGRNFQTRVVDGGVGIWGEGCASS